jgi:hypothetical protein
VKVYRYAWLIVSATLAAVGVTGLLIASTTLFGALFVFFTIVGVILMLPDAGKRRTQPARVRVRRVVTGAFVLGTMATACAGFAIVLGLAALLLPLVVVASSPHALGAYGRWLLSEPASSTTTLAAWAPGLVWPTPGWAPPLLGPELHRLSTETLCQAWCASYLVLVERYAERETGAILATVEERQRYLDELERRNPEGLAAWLASGARVASNPLAYLVEQRIDGPGINWEELT